MNPLIQFVQNLKNLGSLKYAEVYFYLLQQLIQFTGLSEDDKRLSLTYRIKGTLGVNINNRRILAFRKQGKIWCMQVVINDEDIEQNRGVEGYLANLDDSFVRGNKPATLLTFALEAKPYDNETLLQAWLKAVENDLNTSTYSIYSRYNKPFIYRSATNLQARNQILKWVKTDLPTEEVLKTLEMQHLFGIIEEEATENKTRYFVVGSYWKDNNPEDMTGTFIQNNEWVNGYEDKFLREVNDVPFGSQIAIKAVFVRGKKSVMAIKARGEVSQNKKDGRNLVVEWEQDFKPFELDFSGGYWNTIAEVKNPKHIDIIFHDGTPSVSDNKTDIKMPIFPKNQILFGPPGTGKTYNAVAKAVEIADNLYFETNKENRMAIKMRFDELQRSGYVEFITFHQAMSYEDFIEGIKPETNDDGSVRYEVKDGIFKILANRAQNIISGKSSFQKAFEQLEDNFEQSNQNLKINLQQSFFHITEINERLIRFKNSVGKYKTLNLNKFEQIYNNFDNIENLISGGKRTYYKALVEHVLNYETNVNSLEQNLELPVFDQQNHVLIIDEINRGNVANIFGELITLIEDSKRIGRDEALKTTLPYSKIEFGVPQNLYLIGTMNTADRSVEALDTALRRRFSFSEIPPQYNLLKATPEGIDLAVLLRTINDRIELLLDSDHAIGHAYFLTVSDLGDLKTTFQKSILPLLQEYFYADYHKIGLVLGENFVEKPTLKPYEAKKTFAKGFDIEEEDFRQPYRLKDITDIDDPQIFIAIYA